MENAERIVRNLKSLSHVISEPVISLMMRTGRMGAHSTRREQYELVKRVEQILSDTGVDKSSIEAVKKDFKQYVVFDIARDIYKIVKEKMAAVSERYKKEMEAEGPYGQGPKSPSHQVAIDRHNLAQDELKKLRNAFEFVQMGNFPQVFEDAIQDCVVLSNDEREDVMNSIGGLISDMRHFQETGQFRRLDIWLNGELL